MDTIIELLVLILKAALNPYKLDGDYSYDAYQPKDDYYAYSVPFQSDIIIRIGKIREDMDMPRHFKDSLSPLHKELLID
jgi:hypothetical protein